jgi:glycosyltransferase involved in cell wall biosynthesis
VVNFAMARDSPVLAWQERVVRTLVSRCARVVVLTEHVGAYQTAPNLIVHAVPRLLCRFPLRSLGGKWLMAGAVAWWCRRERIAACFLHMNHEWSYRLWPVLRLCGIPALLWYAHGDVHPRLRRSHRCVDAVVTSSPEGFRIPSHKVTTIGQAIDTDVFQLQPPPRACPEIVTVGRIAPRKNLGGVLDAFAAVCTLRPDVPFRLRVVGPTLPGDEAHARALHAHATALGVGARITWTGPLPHEDTASLYARAFLHLNLSRTGSMDKTVLEALACGCPVLTSNEAFRDLLRDHPQLRLTDEPAAAIARRIDALYRQPAAPPATLRALVVGRHDLTGYVARVLAALDHLVAVRPARKALQVGRAVAR